MRHPPRHHRWRQRPCRIHRDQRIFHKGDASGTVFMAGSRYMLAHLKTSNLNHEQKTKNASNTCPVRRLRAFSVFARRATDRFDEHVIQRANAGVTCSRSDLVD